MHESSADRMGWVGLSGGKGCCSERLRLFLLWVLRSGGERDRNRDGGFGLIAISFWR